MNRKGFVFFLAAAFACVAFLGCASVPKEELDEKEAIIRNLNTQVDALKQEVERLQSANEELMTAKSGLQEKVMSLENKLSASQKPSGESAEENIK